MLSTYTFPEFPYRPSPEQLSGETLRHPVVVIGAGPVGLAAGLDLAQRGAPTIILDDNNTVSLGSRAVCYAKRSLEVLDRLGPAGRMIDKGISWQIGKVFFRDKLSYQFDLLPERDHKMPAMINLQQYYLEEFLIDEIDRNPRVDLRWKHKLVAIDQKDDHAVLSVETPDGGFTMEASWVVACDGAGSDTRKMAGGDFVGQFFQDRFLIADVVMKADFPTERWFWFDPPFHPNQSVLLHKQSDDVWRIDFQLGWDADPVEEKKPENVIPRIKAMLGEHVPFELEWVSVYQFACRRMQDFRIGRVLFAGDAAHQVSPFGARGANSGFQDADNLGWKLKLVLDGAAPEALIDSYSAERVYAADDNLMNSTRSTDFITPKSAMSRRFRNAILELAEDNPGIRPLVNSGRLSTPTPYVTSTLNTPDDGPWQSRLAPGTNCDDAPVTIAGAPAWLLNQLGDGFTVLTFGDGPQRPVEVAGVSARIMTIGSGIGADLGDPKGLVAARYDGLPGTTYLIRPDQYVAARWRTFDPDKITAAIAKAIGL